MIRVLVASLAIVVATLTAGPVLGQQMSIQLGQDIARIFEQVDANRRAYDTIALPARGELERLTRDLAEIDKRMAKLPANLDGEERQRRQLELNAQALQLQARFVASAISVVNAATTLIAGNMESLDKLARTVESAQSQMPRAAQIQARIDAQAQTGRQVLRELQTIRRFAEADPAVKARFDSLVASLAAIDRRITADKARLAATRADTLNDNKSRTVAAIEAAIEQLADLYAALQADKDMLADLKQETELAANLGAMAMTRAMVQSTLPAIRLPTAESAVPGLPGLLDSARERSRRMLAPLEQNGPSASFGEPDRSTPPASVPRFRNF